MRDKNGNPISIGDHIEFDAQVYAKSRDGFFLVPTGANLNDHSEVMRCREYYDFYDFTNLFSNDGSPKRGETVETDVYQITNCFPVSGKVEFCKIVGERYERFTVKAIFIKKVQHNEMRVE